MREENLPKSPKGFWGHKHSSFDFKIGKGYGTCRIQSSTNDFMGLLSLIYFKLINLYSYLLFSAYLEFIVIIEISKYLGLYCIRFVFV